MIVRYPVMCITCDTPHTLRIQVGHEDYQEHAFPCAECGEQMIIGMHCDQTNAKLKIVEKDNCKAGTIEGKVVNLSPDFPIAVDELHKDMAFPSGDHIQQFMAAQMALGMGPIPAKDYLNANPALLRRPNTLWPILDKAWSCTAGGGMSWPAQKLLSTSTSQKPPSESPMHCMTSVGECCRSAGPHSTKMQPPSRQRHTRSTRASSCDFRSTTKRTSRGES